MPLEEQLQLARQQYEEALDPNQLPEERNLLEFRIKYRTRAIITRGLYTFYPLFQYCTF